MEHLISFIFLWLGQLVRYHGGNYELAVQVLVTRINEVIEKHNVQVATWGYCDYTDTYNLTDNQCNLYTMMDRNKTYRLINTDLFGIKKPR